MGSEVVAADESKERQLVLEICDLSVSFGDRAVLKDVSLPIRSGAVTAILGPTGSGKSTLLGCLNRTTELLGAVRIEGLVRFQGRSLYGAEGNVAALRRRVGLLFQVGTSVPGSVFDNVALGLRGAGGYSRREVAERVGEAVRRVDLRERLRLRLDDPMTTLSVGERQLVFLARLFATRPEVLLLDQPLDGLDREYAAALERTLQKMCESCAVVWATQSAEEAGRVADFTAFLEDGKLIEYGRTSDVRTSPMSERTAIFLAGVGAGQR